MYNHLEQSRAYKFVCLMLSLILVLSSFPMRLLADILDDEENTFITSSEDVQFEVEAVVTSTWDKHANVDFKIKNTGNETIHNWYFSFVLNYEIENIWNATIYDTNSEMGLYTIKNSDYNQEIRANEEVIVGMTLVSEEIDTDNLISKWYLNTKEEQLDNSKFDVSYTEYSAWDSGFNGAITITNKTIETIKNWTLEFRSSSIISVVNQAVLLDSNEKNYVITNDGFNTNISGNSSISFGIQGVKASESFDISEVVLNYYTVNIGLKEDKDGNGVLDIVELLDIGDNSPESTITPEKTPEVTPTVEVTTDVTITPEPTVDATPEITEVVTPEPTEVITPELTVDVTPEVTPVPEITEEVTPTPENDDDYAFIDSDGDGLTDEEEIFCMTDPYDYDSDDDNLSDFIEVSLGYDPNNPDSDKNGINDGDEDYDGDGLSNIFEIENGTCCFATDSDYDKLNDYEEIYSYLTCPIDEDTDDDGVTDYDEVILGKNPIDPTDRDVKFNQIISQEIENSEDSSLIKVEVEMQLSGLIENEVVVKDMYNKDIFTTDLEGRVGSPISFECEEDFDVATVTFYYDENSLGDTNEEDLLVLWYDEEHGVYVSQKQAVLDTELNKITVELEHFSTYTLVDGLIWLDIPVINSFKFNSIQGNVDYYIAIDMSNAMTSTGLAQAKSILREIQSDYFSSGDRLTVLWFNNVNYGKFDHFATEVDVKEFVDEMCEQIDYYGTIGGAYGKYEMAARGASKMANMFPSTNKGELIIITNDTDPMVARRDVLVWTESNNIDITSVIVDNGSGFGAVGLGDIYFYNGENTFDDFFRGINREIITSYPASVDLTTDSDDDGLPDFIEASANLANGTTTSTDLNSIDTDGDNVPDNEELGVVYEILRGENGLYVEVRLNGVTVYSSVNGGIDSNSQYAFLNDYIPGAGSVYFLVVSNSDPRMPDSDNDGYNDYEDGRPTTVNEDMIYLFCNPNFYDSALWRKNQYEMAGYNVCFYEVVNTTTFDYAWSGIGLSKDYYLYKETGESINKYYYNAEYVVFMTHGNVGCLMLGDINNNPEYLEKDTNHFINLQSKKIESLNLYACLTGRGANCIASDFAKKSGIGQVIAPDTWIWGLKNRYYFIGYSSDPSVSTIYTYQNEADFLEFKDSIDDKMFLLYGWAMSVHDNDEFLDPEGFLRFKGNAAGISIYNNDVFFGDLHEYNSGVANNPKTVGVIVVPAHLLEDYGYVYNDPILDS